MGAKMRGARPSDRPDEQPEKRQIRKGCSGGSIVAHGILPARRIDRMPSRGAARRKAQLAVPPGKRKRKFSPSRPVFCGRATAQAPTDVCWSPKRNGITEMVLPKRRCSPPRARAMSLVNLRLTRHHARVIYLCLGFNVVSEGKKLLG
jgi:hypothetical protein